MSRPRRPGRLFRKTEARDYPYTWTQNQRPAGYKGKRCKIVKKGAVPAVVLVEFQNGRRFSVLKRGLTQTETVRGRAHHGPVLCRKCGANEVPPRIGGERGRPRTCCLECSPYRPNGGVSAEEHRARVLRSQRRRRARESATLQADLGLLCGCGRDYLAVPLEEAHVCPYPLDPISGEPSATRPPSAAPARF